MMNLSIGLQTRTASIVIGGDGQTAIKYFITLSNTKSNSITLNQSEAGRAVFRYVRAASGSPVGVSRTPLDGDRGLERTF